MKTWQSSILQSLLSVFLSLIFFAVIYLTARQPQGQPVKLLPAPTQAPLVVHVAGEVQNPGLYTLPRGSRVQDAILAAGGFSASADQAAVNLAALLRDGEKVAVSAQADVLEGDIPDPESPGGANPKQPTPTVVFPIDLNTATLQELDALPGIGPGRAQEILRYREEHGGFKNIEELKEVNGIGDTVFEQLKDQVVVTP